MRGGTASFDAATNLSAISVPARALLTMIRLG
jgi:hypothetical protein